MQQKTFVERFLKRLDKIDPSEIENFILRLAAQRDFYAQILETLSDGIVILDEAFRVTLTNVAARRIMRWPVRRRVVGEPLLDLIAEGPLRQMALDFMDAPRQLDGEEIVLRVRSQRVYNVQFLPIFEPQQPDELSGGAMILQDITLTRDRQVRTAQAERMASLMTLTAGVAHDIKNPLNSLSIHAQLLERAVGDLAESGVMGDSRLVGRVLRSGEVIREEVERLRKCVDDFIEAARPRRPDFVLQNLNQIIQAVVHMTALEFEERNIQIETFLDPETPPLPLDERQMQQVLRNLIRNAVEAMEAARRPAKNRRITIRTLASDETVTLEVSDNGCGIAQSDLPRIFEPYYTTKFNGSGLGLMAVGRIVREHGGFITVTSAEGEGTTFTIELPVLNPRIKLLEGKQTASQGESEL